VDDKQEPLFYLLVKGSTASIIVCLGYVLCSETLASLITNLGGLSGTAEGIAGWIVRHSIYGMSLMISGAAVSSGVIMSIMINSVAIMLSEELIQLVETAIRQRCRHAYD
jgi:hypothetical protein